MKHVTVCHNVAYTQAYGCRFCLHICRTAFFFGRKKGYAARLEIFTLRHWFRYSRGC
jgi:hypothetical protein